MAEEGEKKSGNVIQEIGSSVAKNEKLEMKPWEQHSTVISIPRFDYNAPSSILRQSHCGFLITCPIKREKSATKEAFCILQKYILHSDAEKIQDFSLVKLTRNGLLLFTYPFMKSPPSTVNILFDIFQSLDSQHLTIPRWCNRIFPIQGTCVLDKKELSMMVSKLVNGFMIDNQNKLGQPVKFAVGYNRRGIETDDLMDRKTCFSVVAAMVKEIVPNSIVDLENPEFAVLVELLPISGVPTGSSLGALSVLPKELFCTKPRLTVKPLSLDTKVKDLKTSD